MTATSLDTADGGDDPTARDDDSTLLETLLARVRTVDLLVLFAVPVALLAVFAFPEATRRSLAFAYHDPTVRSAFTAHYVHLEADHLLANVFAYALLAGVGYLLAVAAGRRRFFFTAFATFCLAFPFALSALNLAVPRRAIGFGFSGINMAFAGLLPLLLAVFVHTHLSGRGLASADLPPRSETPDLPPRSETPDRVPLSDSTAVRLLPATFLVVAGWIGTLALPASTELPGLVGPGVLLGGVLLGALGVLSTPPARRPSLRDGLGRVVDRRGFGDLFVGGAVLAVAYPVVGFPAEPSVDGSVINLYVHLLGFCLGFIGPYTLLAVGVFDDRSPRPGGRSEPRTD
ncbi:hypothetical protein [Halorubrum sp. 48-1-W]|uniref:hypothetical protein n=1 Tax=Halorubrum sp. 48-1-W TaxID=2249761 RepID=UPI001F54014A|nr:hypothetical protein [Halorubrum sp. 48-1-W]